MHEKTNLNNSFSKQRHSVWVALSDLYLDTELTQNNFKYIAKKIKESPYNLDKIKQINQYEVFPTLYPNLQSNYGIWDGFNEKELITSIQNSLSCKNFINKIWYKMIYTFFYKKLFNSYFNQIKMEL